MISSTLGPNVPVGSFKTIKREDNNLPLPEIVD